MKTPAILRNATKLPKLSGIPANGGRMKPIKPMSLDKFPGSLAGSKLRSLSSLGC